MPNIKAAEKWVRQSEKRTTRNKDAKTRLKTVYKRAASGTDAEFAKSVESEFDKAAKSGIIHKNKAARKKSRLAKAMAKAAVAPEKPVKAAAKKTTAKKTTTKKK